MKARALELDPETCSWKEEFRSRSSVTVFLRRLRSPDWTYSSMLIVMNVSDVYQCLNISKRCENALKVYHVSVQKTLSKT